jgi:two-component system LytT family sensor kinase
VIFWLVTIGFHVYTSSGLIANAGLWQWILEVILRNSLLALIIYAHLEYLVPTFAQAREFGRYFLGLTICFGFYVLVKNTHDVFLTVYTQTPAQPFWKYSFYNFSIALFYMAFAMALHLSKEWYLQRERLRKLEVEKLHTELQYLKAQINPHFLFNSLNTIFFQIEKSNVVARDTVSKFADMLRYQLYECGGDSVSMEREIQYLRNFTDLQKLRKDQRYAIEFNAKGDWAGVTIAPMLLMPLVENAFKHVSHFTEGNLIQVFLSRSNESITAVISNTWDPAAPKSENGGIGLTNLVRRLELQYPDTHTFDIDQTKSLFKATLTLALAP